MINPRRSIFTVSEITRHIKGALETGFSHIAVQGEISNFKRHSSGHLYFTLKDEDSQLQVTMWRSRAANLFFTPQDGMKIIARGNITVYEARGVYQLDAAHLQPLGIGELQIAFEKLKEKLAAEGLFDAERKRPLPVYPERIGLVTSPTGAVIRDIMNIISRRYPVAELILVPVKVQGVGAAKEIASAIKTFNDYGKIDVMIVGRGGGSLEDLWAFNEEIVARAIYQSAIPIVSAVGHEIDFTIADFVADMRAPTPSAAAELVVPRREDLVEIVRNYCYTAQQIVSSKLTSERERITSLLRSYSFNRPFDLLRQHSQKLDEVQRGISHSTAHRFSLLRQQADALHLRIKSLSPVSTLQRGYAIVSRNAAVISRAISLKPEDVVQIRFADDQVVAEIK